MNIFNNVTFKFLQPSTYVHATFKLHAPIILHVDQQKMKFELIFVLRVIFIMVAFDMPLPTVEIYRILNISF